MRSSGWRMVHAKRYSCGMYDAVIVWVRCIALSHVTLLQRSRTSDSQMAPPTFPHSNPLPYSS